MQIFTPLHLKDIYGVVYSATESCMFSDFASNSTGKAFMRRDAETATRMQIRCRSGIFTDPEPHDSSF